MVKLFAMVKLKEALTENLFAHLQSYMNSRVWKSYTSRSNGITVRLPEGPYLAVFENDVNCLTIVLHPVNDLPVLLLLNLMQKRERDLAPFVQISGWLAPTAGGDRSGMPLLVRSQCGKNRSVQG